MRKAHIFLGIAVLLWGTPITIGQIFCNPCTPNEVNLCDPCEPVCGRPDSPFTFSGWLDFGVYTNSRGFNNNGPMYTGSKRRNDFVMNQLYLSAEKEMNTRRGFDWGVRADFVYGAHAGSMQTYGDETFDYDWGTNRHGYSMSAYKLYGTLGYKDLSVKIGKFGTPIGWEASASKDNFFYSHSYCYWIEPATHMGVLADFNLTDRLTVNAGWVTGEDSSFKNPHHNKAILTGLTYALADNATVYYWFNGGKQYDDSVDYFVQSVCFEWEMTKRFTYVLQYNLRNDNVRGGPYTSAYGINNHFLYKLTDQWGVGTRFEWLRNNGDYISNGGGTDFRGDFYQVTLGLNWNPCSNVSIRPEVRYDWCDGATPFGQSTTFGHRDGVITGTRSSQVSGGCGVVVTF